MSALNVALPFLVMKARMSSLLQPTSKKQLRRAMCNKMSQVTFLHVPTYHLPLKYAMVTSSVSSNTRKHLKSSCFPFLFTIRRDSFPYSYSTLP